MEIAGADGGDEPGWATVKWHTGHAGLTIVPALVADAHLEAVGGQDMVVVAVDEGTRVEKYTVAGGQVIEIEASGAVEQDAAAIRHPVGRLDVLGEPAQGLPFSTFDVKNFKKAYDAGDSPDPAHLL
jgi:hypothetical protein